MNISLVYKYYDFAGIKVTAGFERLKSLVSRYNN